MTPNVQELADKLKASVTDPGKQDMLAAIAADSSRIAVLALTNPHAAEEEVAIVKATLANIGQAEAANAVQAVTEWVTDAVSRVMSKALPV
jgi:predicted aconitase